MLMHADLGNSPAGEIRIDARAGRWVGVKNGVFCVHKDCEGASDEVGFATVDYVRYNR